MRETAARRKAFAAFPYRENNAEKTTVQSRCAPGTICILASMQIEETPPNKPKFILVVYMFAGAVIVIVLAAIIIIGWRNRKGHKTPYDKTPTSWLAAPPQQTPARMLVHGQAIETYAA